MTIRHALCAVFVTAVLFPMTALAEDASGNFPNITGNVDFEIQDDYIHDNDVRADEYNNLRAKIEPFINIHFNDRTSLNAHFTFEEVQDHDPFDDVEFDNHGLYVEELTANYKDDRWGVFGGKFDPNFGIGYDRAPGIWGNDMSEDTYQLVEKIGGGGYFDLTAGEMNQHTLSASLYRADTSFLSDSEITSRGRLARADGGASNTDSFSSFTVALDGVNVMDMTGLGYHLGLRHQAEGDADAGGDDETGFAAAVDYVMPLSGENNLYLIGEWVGLANFQGLDGDDMNLVTAGAQYNFGGGWNVAGSLTLRSIDYAPAVVADQDDHSVQLTAGYAFENGISVDAGWRATEEADVDASTLGARLTYSVAF